MFGKKNEKPKTKEFMKYEDGEIVSIEVEQKPKPIPIDRYPQETEPETPVAELRKEKIKAFFTKKRLIQIGCIILFILFLFASYDVYRVFFVTGSETKNNSTPNNTTNQVNQTPTPTQKPVEPPVTSPKPTDGTVPSTNEPKPTETPKGTTEPDKSENSVLRDLLTLANQINTNIVQISTDELNYVDNYHRKQANKISLRSHLKRSLDEKSDLYVTLGTYKSVYTQNKMDAFYEATENRLIQSIAFTKQLDAILSSDTGSTYTLVQDYPAVDQKLKQKVQDELINILKGNNISFTVNEQLNQVEYTIQ